MHPQPRVRFVVGVCTRVFTAEAPDTSGIPHAMVLRLISRSPRGPGFLAPVIPEKLASQELGASVGASGPHDFTVRDLGVRLTRGRVHRIPLPTFVTIAKRPSSRPRDARKSARDLPDGTSALACDMLARRAICAWQACWARRLHNLGHLRRSPGAPSTPQPCAMEYVRRTGRVLAEKGR
jgi:hypothetical protein